MAPLRLLLLASLHLLVAADSYDEPGGAKDGALSFSHEPLDLVVGRGRSARLDCLVGAGDEEASGGAGTTTAATATATAPGTNGFAVTCYQDGEPLHLPDARRRVLANGSLHFDKVLHKRPGRNISDEGVYFCVAHQSAAGGSASSSSTATAAAADSGGGSLVSRNGTVQVAALARDFAFWPADSAVETGDSVRFGCWIESVPEADVDWEKDGKAVESVDERGWVAGSRFVVLPSGALHIYQVREEDAGNYRCVAKNSLAGKERKSPAGRLTVAPASGEGREPMFISPPMSSVTPDGSAALWVTDKSNVTLECLVTARPPVSVKWTLNSSVPLPGAGSTRGGRATLGPGFLTLSDVGPAMSGDYTCSATGASVERGTNVTVTRTTSVRVATAPRFVRAPQSQVFPTAKTVRFECQAAGTPTPDIRWLKDGRPLHIGGRIKNKVTGGGSSQLVLSNTVTQDSGVYQCQAMNRAGIASTAARLLVNITGRRPEPPSRLRAAPLSPSELVLSWDPPRNVPLDDVTAYTVHYTLVGKGGSGGVGGGLGGLGGGDETQELALNNSHHVRQLVRNGNYSFYVRAYIRKSASDPSEKLTFNAAHALAQPTSPPTPLPRPPSKTLPPPPSGAAAAPSVDAQPLSPTTLRVTWNKFPSSVSLYKILFRRHNKKDFDIEVVKGDVLEYNITGLHPGKKYDVRVAPGSMNVLGPWVTVDMPPVSGDASTNRSPPAPSVNPLAAPAVQLLSAEPSSVVVAWQDRGPATGRKKAQSVLLTYRVQGSRDTSQRLVLPASGSRRIDGLRAGSVYEFQLVAASGAGQEGPAATRTIRTLWETASGMENEMEDGLDLEQGAVHLDAEVASSTEIRLKWKPVEHPDGVLYYTVRYVAVAQEPPVSLGAAAAATIGCVRSTDTQVVLSNLTGHSVYQLSVRSHDAHGRSSAFSSPPVVARTPTDVPGPPSDVSWLITPEDEIQLTWRQPILPNGVIASYAILVSADAHAPLDDWTIQEEPGSRFRAQLGNLTAEVAYYVRMRARTAAGWGPLTEPITVQLRSDERRDKTAAPANSARSELPAGVIVGLIVALCLTVVVVVSLVLTMRCSKAQSHNRPASGSPTAVSVDASIACRPLAGVSVANGGLAAASNGYPARSKATHRRKGLFGTDSRPQQASTWVEMDALVPMLATIPGDAPADLDTKGGGYATSSRGVRRLATIPSDEVLGRGDGDETIRDEEEDDAASADRSHIPLLLAVGATCLSAGFASPPPPPPPDRSRGGRRRRRDSLHSHDDSSLHSLDDSSDTADDERNSIGSASSRSLRGRDDDDTGICHADHHMMISEPDAGGTSSTAAPTSPASSCASSGTIDNNNSINNNSTLGNNNNNNNNNGAPRATPAAVT